LGEEIERSKPLFWEWRNGQAVREGDWKLVRDGLESDWELYNMKEDPVETMNVAPQYPERVVAMTEMFRKWKNDNNTLKNN
jgi:arylsulfatase